MGDKLYRQIYIQYDNLVKFAFEFFSSIKQACATAYTNTITCVIELGYMQSTIIGM